MAQKKLTDRKKMEIISKRDITTHNNDLIARVQCIRNDAFDS